MASEQVEVVTAIRDMNQEGLIAAALSRLGWKVSYRAMDSDALHKFLDGKTKYVIVASDDFKGVERLNSLKIITLRGVSQPLIAGAIEFPSSDSDLHHAMNSIAKNSSDKLATYPKIKSRVISLASIGRYVGTTTIAINFASELASQARSVLLIDGHSDNPSISTSLEVHGIKDCIAETEYGFDVTEIADVGRIQEVSELASHYDLVIIDIGELRLNSRISVGSRLADVITTWALKSSERLQIVTDIRANLNQEILKTLHALRTVAEIPYVERIIQASESLPKREVDQYKKCSEEELGIQTYFFSYDRRAVQAIRRDPRPLIMTAAKSVLRGQIQSHLAASENSVQSRGR